MNREEIINTSRRAFNENAIDKLFLGEEPFQIPPGKYSPSLMPVDTGAVLFGLGSLTFLKKEKLTSVIEQTLSQICSTELGLLVAADVIYLETIHKNQTAATSIGIDVNNIARQLKANCQALRNRMEKNYKWDGEYYKDGLWGAYKNISELVAKYGGPNIL